MGNASRYPSAAGNGSVAGAAGFLSMARVGRCRRPCKLTCDSSKCIIR